MFQGGWANGEHSQVPMGWNKNGVPGALGWGGHHDNP